MAEPVSIQTDLADLQQRHDLTHSDRLAEVNSRLAAFHAEHGDTLADVFTHEAAILRQGIVNFREFVDGDEGILPRELVKTRLNRADEISTGQNMDTRVSTRLAMFGGKIQVAADVDGTITTDPTYLEAAIPASRLAEPMLAEHPQGRDGFPDVFVKTWRYVLQYAPRLFEDGGKSEHVKIRKGVSRFFRELQRQGAPRNILSANFEPFVRGVLSKTDLARDPQLRIYANTADDITPTDKATYLHAFAQANPDRALIYIGDGASDVPTLEASDVVVCYFALEGSKFEKELKARNIPHFTYRDFDDITLQLMDLQALVQPTERKSRAALAV